MDDDSKKPPEQVAESRSQSQLLQLPDGAVGETETDAPQPDVEPKHVSFELPGTSWQATLLHQKEKLDEANVLVKDLIETLLPRSESENDSDAATIVQEPLLTATTTTTTTTTTPSHPQRLDEERLQRILRLLDRYTRNLEVIEEHLLSSNNNRECTTELQVTHDCELATQTVPVNSLRLDVVATSSTRPKGRGSRHQEQQQQHQQQQQQQQQAGGTIPPCECRYHTITISTNSSAAFVPPARPRTFLGRIGQTLGDFAGAICLCLQVNKDCVFCLGFFVAFVISASFLTAFFYRSINLTHSSVRVAVDSVENTPGSTSELVTLPFDGGYYYVYNSHRQHFV